MLTNRFNLRISMDKILLQLREIVGEKAFEDFYEVYNDVVLKKENSDQINEILKIMYLAGMVKGKEHSNDILKSLKLREYEI